MHHHAQSLAGIVMYSPDPERLAAFYRDAIGVSLAAARHGTVGTHQEGLLGEVHFAVWDARVGHAAGALVPVLRVDDLLRSGVALENAGARRLHKIIDLGEGKRVAGYADPDGRALRLIQIGAPVDA